MTLNAFVNGHKSRRSARCNFLLLPVASFRLRPNTSLQEPIHEHPQAMFFPKYQRPSFTPIQNNMQNSSVSLVSTNYNRMRILEETVREAYKCVDFV